jgi:predicted dehydrogenase
MAPHANSPTATDFSEQIDRLPGPERPAMSESPPRFLVIGAGSRGNSYARAMRDSTNGFCVAVAEPIPFKRQQFGRNFIWGKNDPSEGQEFSDWTEFLKFELERRKRAADGESVPEGVDGVFICVQDHLHKDVIVGLKELNLHVMCEKPLATNMDDCVAIYRALLPANKDKKAEKIVSIGHVLRYSPHNMLLRKLLLEDKVIGDVLSINHTEPVGWWHFSHSYVR